MSSDQITMTRTTSASRRPGRRVSRLTTMLTPTVRMTSYHLLLGNALTSKAGRRQASFRR